MTSSLFKKNEGYYFNRTALLHISFIVILYALFDGYLIDYNTDNNAYSKSYYTKLVITILYMIGSQQRSITAKDDTSIDAAFHFSGFVFCIWLAITSFTIVDGPLSRYIGIFLIFGGFAGFNLMVGLLETMSIKLKQRIFAQLIIGILLKMILFTTFCLAIFFLITGEWRWDIKSFGEWY